MNIYASKMFRTSPRQDRIKAAASNPINQELVIQLKNQLRDEDAFKDPDALEPKKIPESKEDSKSESKSTSSGASRMSGGGGSFHPSSPSGPSKSLSDKFMDAEEKLGDEDGEPVVEEKVEEKETQEVESATNIPLTPQQSIAEQVDSLAGTLNADEATTGVRYAVVKDNEVWIYYGDGTNLNNVMEAVIKTLASAGYAYLEFNRLARSNNAMVFTITESAIPLQAIE